MQENDLATLHSCLYNAPMQDWQTWLASGTIVPHFQPIISVETQQIYGYEVLGRLLFPTGKTESMGPFFNADIPKDSPLEEKNALEDLKRTVDRTLRKKAIEILAASEDQEAKVFFNVSPSQMYRYVTSGNGGTPQTIQLIRDAGFSPHRVVIEITEERFEADLESLQELLALYRQEGFRVAVDDVGSESSNLDRIGLFHPEIIKVDLQLLRRSLHSRSFKKILVHLAKLGESVGSSLLFEGVESQEELYQALETGARYLQGFYFSRAQAELLPRDRFSTLMKQGLDQLLIRRQGSILQSAKWEQIIRNQLDSLEIHIEKDANVPLVVCTPTEPLSRFLHRAYLTDHKGYQVSPNLTWDLQGLPQYDSKPLGHNWSTRPYFFDHLFKDHKKNQDWAGSKVYRDATDRHMIKTFSRELSEGYLLFLDVVTED